MKRVQDIPYDDLVAIVEAIRETLYPNGDADHEWSTDELDAIAGILHDNDLTPGP